MSSFRKILVVSRSTRECKKAVQAGITLARQSDAALYLMHVLHDPFNIDGWNLPLPGFHDAYEKMAAEAGKDLERLVKAEKEKGTQVTEMVRRGKPEDEIQEFVEKEGIDLIIMMAHEEGHIEHFLFGRTNHETIRRLPASILLVKK